MPQHQLIKTEAAVTGVTVRISEHEGIEPGGYDVAVLTTWSTGVTATVFAQTYRGVTQDLLEDLAKRVTVAFLYGERGDIARAALMNWKTARAHAKHHATRRAARQAQTEF